MDKKVAKATATALNGQAIGTYPTARCTTSRPNQRHRRTRSIVRMRSNCATPRQREELWPRCCKLCRRSQQRLRPPPWLGVQTLAALCAADHHHAVCLTIVRLHGYALRLCVVYICPPLPPRRGGCGTVRLGTVRYSAVRAIRYVSVRYNTARCGMQAAPSARRSTTTSGRSSTCQSSNGTSSPRRSVRQYRAKISGTSC